MATRPWVNGGGWAAVRGGRSGAQDGATASGREREESRGRMGMREVRGTHLARP